LKGVLSTMWHILRDSKDFVDRVTGLRVGPLSTLGVIDIKEFFMSGTHQIITSSTSSQVDIRFREVYKALLSWLLKNQYIQVHNVPNAVWRVLCGTGMGSLMSGELADVCFFILAEASFVLLDNTHRVYGLDLWVRFKDDCFLIMSGSSDQRKWFFRRLKRASSCYKLEVNKLARDEVQFLDTEVFIQDFHVKTRIYTKPTSIKNFLSPTSDHMMSVHVSWPPGEVARFKDRCTDREDAETEIAAFRSALRTRFGIQCDDEDNKSVLPKVVPYSRLILPFNKVWSSAKVPKLLRRLDRNNAMFLRHLNSLFVKDFNAITQLGWRLENPSLAMRIRSCSRLNNSSGQSSYGVVRH